MAQLVKLYDYISRYQNDPYRYPGQFIRLKKQQWIRTLEAWEKDEFFKVMKEGQPPLQEKPREKRSFFQRLRKNRKSIDEFQPIQREKKDDDGDEDFMVQFTRIPKNREDLKHLFLDYIFHFQIRWASSTLRHKSAVEKFVYKDQILRHFVQGLPDHYFLLYRPVFLLKNAQVELDLILIGTTEVYCLTLIEHLEETVFSGSKEKFWLARKGEQERKLLSPLLSLNRTGTIVQKILNTQQIDLEVKKIIISRNGYIDYPFAPHDIMIKDKRSYRNWYEQLRNSSAPIKHKQIKAVHALLSHCLTNAFSRKEWKDDSDNKLL